MCQARSGEALIASSLLVFIVISEGKRFQSSHFDPESIKVWRSVRHTLILLDGQRTEESSSHPAGPGRHSRHSGSRDASRPGVVLKLPAYEGVAGNTIYDDPHPGWLTTKAMIMYRLDAGNADALMAQSAKAVRVMTDSGHHDVRIHKSNVDDIRRAIECVQE